MMFEKESDRPERSKSSISLPVMVAILLGVLILALGAYFGLALMNRLEEMEAKMADLTGRVAEATETSERALRRAADAESSSAEAARGRARAESEADQARGEAEAAHRRAAEAEAESESAREEARVAHEEAERAKQEWEAEVNRLYEAFDQIVETRKTALGLVLNLSEEYLKFDFDKATLRPENRELLSRIAGILLTSKDYSVTVFGHTDDIGTDAYNQGLSERRAEAVRDYLVAAGLDPNIMTTEGMGESQPLVAEKTPEARAKNRRVEIGIVNTRIRYGGHPQP